MLPGALVVLRSTASFCVAGQGSLASLASPRVVSLAIASLARLLSHPFLLALALISSSLVAVVQFNNRTDKVCKPNLLLLEEELGFTNRVSSVVEL